MGCGDDVEAGDEPGGSTLELPVADVDLDVDAPAYSTGREIRIGEVTIPVDPTPEEWVVGPHGIYYLTDETLWFADEDGSEEVATVGFSELVLSPDRSLLGLADLASGPPDQFDTPVAVPVVFDLETGEEVLRGEPADATDEDLAVLYGEIEPPCSGSTTTRCTPSTRCGAGRTGSRSTVASPRSSPTPRRSSSTRCSRTRSRAARWGWTRARTAGCSSHPRTTTRRTPDSSPRTGRGSTAAARSNRPASTTPAPVGGRR